MRVIGVNGIATHGEGNIDVLIDALGRTGIKTVDVPLPKRHFFSAWWGHKQDAELIADCSSDGDIVMCHSFGGPRTAEAMRLRNYAAVLFIAPAMSREHVFTRQGIYCIHSANDWAVTIGSYIPMHPFGLAGVTGFTDPNVNNVAITGGHNAAFEEHFDSTFRLAQRIVRNHGDA